MYVTHHAKKRLHEREGTKKSAVNRKASLVLERGYKVEEIKGRLRRWVESNRTGEENMRIYGDKLYIFVGETLITVYKIPNELLGQLRGKDAQKNKGHRHYRGCEEEGL